MHPGVVNRADSTEIVPLLQTLWFCYRMNYKFISTPTPHYWQNLCGREQSSLLSRITSNSVAAFHASDTCLNSSVTF